jgi:predicted permease
MGKLWRKLYYFWNRRQLERELADEMEAHREMMAPDRRSHFGNATLLREESHDAWTWNWIEQFLRDLAYGARMLARSPGFTLGAVAVLALGVGVNLAEFEIFDGMIFHRLHFRDVQSLLQFSRVSRQREALGFAPAAVEFLRAKSRSFAWLASEDYQAVVVEGDAGLRADLVPGDYFSNVGIVPAWGRLFDTRDTQPGAAPVAVLSYEYWQSHWGADPAVVGRLVHINNQPVEIAGVAPYDFDGLSSRWTDVWLPVTLRPALLSGSPAIQEDYTHGTGALFGKLKPGVAQAAGDAELTVLVRELARTRRAFGDDDRIQSQFVQSWISRRTIRSPAVSILLVMILLVLLSACANLASMLVARGLAREREIQIRAAIGASRARIVRQLMTENLLLAILGSLAGLGFGALAARLFLRLLDAPRWLEVSTTRPILAASLALMLLSTLVFGLPSALQTVRQNPRRSRLRQSLVGVQVSVSCLLLIASAVLAHNGIASSRIDLAFDYQNMIVIYPQLYAQSLTPAVAAERVSTLSDRLAAMPGILGVTAAVAPPLSGRLRIDNLPGLPPLYRNSVASTYFGVMNVPILLGRTFAPGEDKVAVVSESAARAAWPNQQPLGKTLRLAGADCSIVGVVKDSGANLLADRSSVEVYVPIAPIEMQRSALILHTRSDPAPLVRLIPPAAGDVKETVSAVLMRTSREQILEVQRRMVLLIGSLGAIATSLAAVGMFALVAFAVAQRRRELGIRIAIGARARNILAVLLSQNFRPTMIGVAAGAILAAILAKLVRTFVDLPNQNPVDPIGFAAGIAGFVVVAALATLSPAMRALRIDPSETLREE